MLDLDKLEQQLDDALKNTPQEWWNEFVKQAKINRQNENIVIDPIPSTVKGFTIKIISSDLVQLGQAILYVNDKDYERIYGKK